MLKKYIRKIVQEEILKIKLGMEGPYSLDEKEINHRIEAGKIGNYVYLDNKFIVKYVGRSDTDLKKRITHGIGRYKYFMFSYAKTVKEAYETECKNYHDFGGDDGCLDNNIHPAKPEDSGYVCPICKK